MNKGEGRPDFKLSIPSKNVIIVVIVLFNIFVSLGFVFSNVYVRDFLYSETDVDSAFSQIYFDFFKISVSNHPVFVDGVLSPSPLPRVIANFPFILFWISVIGNLILFAIVLRKN